MRTTIRPMTRRDVLSVLLGAPFSASRPQNAPRDDEIAALSVREALALIANGTLSAPAMAEGYLARIARVNPTIGAYITVTAERARTEARRARAGPLAGLPIAHKDLFETAAIRTTAGSRLFDTHVPRRDADIVSRLARAGAVCLGKTNTHELGGGVTTINPFFGTTRNPVDATRIAGGSSGGSAAAVVAHLAAAATGSDTGGSIRIPAAFCGAAGFKPTFGRLSTSGLLGACPTFDHVGIIARSADDVSIVFGAVTGGGPPSVPPDLAASLRIGVARAFFFEGLQPDVAAAIERALDRFRAMGATVIDRDLPVTRDTMARVFDPIVVSEIWQRYDEHWRRRPHVFSSEFAAFFKTSPPNANMVRDARRALTIFQRDVDTAFAGLDAIVTPTVPITAPPIGGPVDGALILRNTWPFNAARTPTISVRCGLDAHGLPVGLQIAGRRGDDDRLLMVATSWERADISPRPPRGNAGNAVPFA